MSSGRRAGVLGHPIAHSLSPTLHRAAYAGLGLADWDYDAFDVTVDELPAFVASVDDSWAGLSLTMPLKVAAVTLMDFVEPMAKLLGVVNTILVQHSGGSRHLVGANTDVHGVAAALREAGLGHATHGVIVGGGATATSAMAALAPLGVTSPTVAVRSRARAGGLIRVATKMGLAPRLVTLEDAPAAMVDADVVVSTVPADAGALIASEVTAASGVLLDVVYDPRPTPLAAQWARVGGAVAPGERMLLHQAAEQVRLMTGRNAPIDLMDDALRAELN